MRNKNWVIYTHHKPHPDEIAGIRDLLRHGEGKQIGQRKLVGISKAKIVFVDAGEDYALSLEQTNIITVGTGKQLFDEHISAPDADRMQTCAALLVSKALEIEETPMRKRWLEFLYFHDSQGRRTQMDFADFVAALNLMCADEEVMRIGIEIVDALLDLRCADKETTKEDRDAAADFIERWLKDKDPEATGPIVNFVRGIRHGNKAAFDFTEIFTKLKMVYGEGLLFQGEAKKIATQLLEAKYNRQKTRYCEAEKLVEDPNVTGQQRIIRRDGEFLVVYTKIPVDNEDYNKAARKKLGADVIIQGNGNGRVLIFTNAKTPMRREITNIAGMIRLREMKARQIPIQTAYQRLTYGGAIEEVPQWYFQIENTAAGGKLLNGSQTTNSVEPTAIPLDQIIEIVVKALELGFKFNWQVWVRNELDSRI